MRNSTGGGATRADTAPRKVSALSIVAAIPAFARQFKLIPREYFRHLDSNDPDHVCVACMCGRRPIVGRGELVVCQRARSWVPTRVQCDRAFIYTRRGVYAMRNAA